MAVVPNLFGLWRACYVVAGVVLAAWGLSGVSASWAMIGLLVLAGALIVEGLIGF